MSQGKRAPAEFSCYSPRIQTQVFQELLGQKTEQSRSSWPQGQPEREEVERPCKRPCERKRGGVNGRLKAQGSQPGEASEVKTKGTEHARAPG